jgi:hypothetical protein
MTLTGGGGRQRTLPRLLLASILVAAFACSPGEPGEAGFQGTADSRAVPELPATTPRQTSVSSTMTSDSDSLRLRLDLPEQVPGGVPVRIRLVVENLTDRSLDLYLRGRQISFDLVVEARAGDTVWRRLENEVIPAILRLETLAPRQSLTLEDTWDQRSNQGARVPPGAYRVHAELLTEGDPLVSPSRTLHIE